VLGESKGFSDCNFLVGHHPNPRTLAKHADNLAKLQRRLSKKKKGSQNRQKAKQKIALAHLKVSNTRKDFHHKVSTGLVNRFDVIAVEALKITNMVRNHHLAKSILDVAWGSFFLMIQSKAENAGRGFEKVIPNHTSTDCCICGHRQKMPLSVRVFDCENCHNKIDRDHNSGINILNRSERDRIKARGDAIAHLRSGNVMAETSAAPLGAERVAFSHLRR
jgi:putative transposase